MVVCFAQLTPPRGCISMKEPLRQRPNGHWRKLGPELDSDECSDVAGAAAELFVRMATRRHGDKRP